MTSVLLSLVAAGVLALSAPPPDSTAPPAPLSSSPPAAAGTTIATPGPSVGWGWPVAGPDSAAAEVVRVFERPPHRYAAGHRGVDLAAEPGDAVLAPAHGVVTLARTVAGTPVVVIAHGAVRSATELRSTFEAAVSPLAPGTSVRRGQVIGAVVGWAEHCRERPCLHWGVRRGLDYVDPLVLVRGPVRLLPHGPPVPRDRLQPLRRPVDGVSR